MILAILVDKFSQSTKDTCQQLHQIILIFKPDTVLRWHRELVQRKWTFSRKAKPGRPTISSELEALILRLANENPRWGYDKIQRELLKLGYRLIATSVRNILKRHGIDQQIPIPSAISPGATVQCRNILGGIIHNYYRATTHTALSTT